MGPWSRPRPRGRPTTRTVANFYPARNKKKRKTGPMMSSTHVWNSAKHWQRVLAMLSVVWAKLLVVLPSAWLHGSLSSWLFAAVVSLLELPYGVAAARTKVALEALAM